jgi:hypothetical protein
MGNLDRYDAFSSLILIFGSPLSLLVVLLQKDIITLPYLTPLVHSIWEFFTPAVLRVWPIFSCIAPFTGPLKLAVIIYLLRHPKYNLPMVEKIMVVNLALQYVPRVVTAIYTIWQSRKEEFGGRGFDLGEQWKAWVEILILMMLGAVVAMGWRWDEGYLERMVARGLEKFGESKNGKGKYNRLEKGERRVEDCVEEAVKS